MAILRASAVADLVMEWVDSGDIYQPMEIGSEAEVPCLGLLGLRTAPTHHRPGGGDSALTLHSPEGRGGQGARRGFSAAYLPGLQTATLLPCPRVVFPPCARL